MNRRHFLAGLASALFLPYEPKRIYSFGSDVGRPQRYLYPIGGPSPYEYRHPGAMADEAARATIDPRQFWVRAAKQERIEKFVRMQLASVCTSFNADDYIFLPGDYDAGIVTLG